MQRLHLINCSIQVDTLLKILSFPKQLKDFRYIHSRDGSARVNLEDVNLCSTYVNILIQQKHSLETLLLMPWDRSEWSSAKTYSFQPPDFEAFSRLNTLGLPLDFISNSRRKSRQYGAFPDSLQKLMIIHHHDPSVDMHQQLMSRIPKPLIFPRLTRVKMLDVLTISNDKEARSSLKAARKRPRLSNEYQIYRRWKEDFLVKKTTYRHSIGSRFGRRWEDVLEY